MSIHSLDQVIAMDDDPAEFILGPYLLPAGGRALLGGTKGVGKSVLVMNIARAVATGEPLFGWQETTVPVPGRVLVLDRELGWATIKQRAQRIFADCESALGQVFYEHSADSSLLWQPGLPRLKRMLDEIKPRLLVIDPLFRFLGGYETNEMIARLLNLLGALQEEYHPLGIIIVHHFKKPPRYIPPNSFESIDDLSAYNFRGGILYDDASCVFTLKRESTKPWVLRMRVESRHGPPLPESMLEIDSDFRSRVVQRQPTSAFPLLITARHQG